MCGNQEQTDQLRSEINSSLRELEQAQARSNRLIPKVYPSRTARSTSPILMSHRSASADEQRYRRLSPKVSFRDDPISDK